MKCCLKTENIPKEHIWVHYCHPGPPRFALTHCRYKYEQDVYIFLWISQTELRKTRSIFKVKEKVRCKLNYMYMNIYDGASIYVNLGHSEKPKKWDKFGKNEFSTTCIIDIKVIIIVSYTFTHILLCLHWPATCE